MTGMSSLIGYTRLHVPHLSAVPFLTSVTGVLQLGHARISSSSGSTDMAELYDTSPLLWNNSGCMKVLVFLALVRVSAPFGQAAQSPPKQTAEAYHQFMLGRHLEAGDDIDGAIAAYKRAMALDPTAADAAAELAALYMR